MRIRFDSVGILRFARRPAVKLCIGAGLVFYFVYYLTRFDPVRIRLLVPTTDTWIIFERTSEIFAHADYPARLDTGNTTLVFPYPPSAVLLFRGLEIFGPRVFIAVWMILMTAASLVTFRSSLAGEGDDIRSAWLALGAASLVFADWPVSWDLRSGNCNLVYLGLVLAGYGFLHRRPWLAGALVGLSISLKLYSGLLLVWLLVNGARQALYAAAIAIVVLSLLLPVALFGLDGTIRLYAGWHEQIRIISGLWVYPIIAVKGHGPPLMTLRRAVINLTGAGPRASLTRSLILLSWIIWLTALLWYIRRALICGRVVPPSRAALADWTILMLVPLPLSPWIEPYHMVPIVPGTILCLAISLDESLANRQRVIAAGALLLLLATNPVVLPFPIRGLGMLAQCLVLMIAFGLLRPRLSGQIVPALTPLS